MEIKYDGFEIVGIRQVVEGEGTLSFGKGIRANLDGFSLESICFRFEWWVSCPTQGGPSCIHWNNRHKPLCSMTWTKAATVSKLRVEVLMFLAVRVHVSLSSSKLTSNCKCLLVRLM